MTRYTYSEIDSLVTILNTRINKIRKQPSHVMPNIPSELEPIKLVIHEWNNLKCLRLTRPFSDHPTSESEFTRYVNTYEGLAIIINAIHESISLID